MAGLIPTDPITLTNALTGYNVIPGDIIHLRAGTYSMDMVNEIIGTSENPVTIKAYRDPDTGQTERVILHGDFTDAAAEYVTYIDLEFAATRTPTAAVYPSGPAHSFSGTGVKLINCILHDSINAAAWDAVDLIYGCITYNHGIVVDGSGGMGHSLYTQNQDSNHQKIIKHSIFGRSANYGLHGYATAFALENVDIIENVLLPGSIHLIGSQKADDGILFDGNHGFGQLQIGYGAHDHTDLTATDNILFNQVDRPFQLFRYASGDVSGNTFVSGVSGGDAGVYTVDFTQPVGASTLTMDNNAYYARNGKTQAFHENGVGDYTLAQWRTAYGYDLSSTIATNGSSPADTVHVYPNEYASISKRKGLVIIWNWSQAATVSVDLSSLSISAGASYRFLQAQDPLNDVRTGIMPANHIVSVSMTGTIASVSGWADPPATFPEFGCFVVESP